MIDHMPYTTNEKRNRVGMHPDTPAGLAVEDRDLIAEADRHGRCLAAALLLHDAAYPIVATERGMIHTVSN